MTAVTAGPAPATTGQMMLQDALEQLDRAAARLTLNAWIHARLAARSAP